MHKRNFSFAMVSLIVMVLLFMVGSSSIFSQDYKDQVRTVIYLDRGIVWDTFIGNSGTSFDSFNRTNHGFDYPGFEPDIVQAENVGTWATHHYGIGFGVTANRKPIYPAIPQVEEYQFALGAWSGTKYNTNKGDTSQSYIHVKVKERWENMENFFLKVDALESEELIDIEWTYNTNYKFPHDVPPVDRHHIPMKLEKKVRIWSGSRQNQYWFIHQYTFTNITDDPSFKDPSWGNYGQMTLYDFIFMLCFPARINERSASFIGQGQSRDDRIFFDPAHNLIYQIDRDYLDASSPDEDTFDFYKVGGLDKKGEYLAPAHLGTSLLYTTPNRDGESAKILGYWTTRWHNIGLGTERPWEQTTAYLLIPNGGRSPMQMLDRDWGNEAFVSLINTGVWDIAPGESVTIVWFSGIGSVDLETCYGPNASKAKISTGLDSLKRNVETAQLAANMALVDGYAAEPQYKGWNIPDPPACPTTFNITPYYGEVPGNTVIWGDEAESVPDRDYTGAEANDLAGYTVWRSEWLPFEGWRPVANIPKGNTNYYDQATKKYTFVDKAKEGDPNSVKVGFTYYYAISTYDTGHKTWPPKPEAFPNGVPPLQSSYQASMNYHFDKSKWKPFRTLRNPGSKLSDIRVVPNPFVMQAGFTTPRDTDTMQFVNLPGKCTIRIYSTRGDLVQILEHTDGSGTQTWNQRTKGEQFAESGIYIYHIESHIEPTKGQTIINKFVIVR